MNEDIHRLLTSEADKHLVAAALAEAATLPPKEAGSGALPRPPEADTLPFDAYTADQLADMDLAPIPQLVEGLLTPGLCLLAGAPKRGKSWMALWLAVCVAEGREFLGRAVLRGSALYADLEGRKHRMAERLEALLGDRWGPQGLTVTHQLRPIEEGLLAQLEAYCDARPDARLLILDTLARVKGGARRGAARTRMNRTRGCWRRCRRWACGAACACCWCIILGRTCPAPATRWSA